MPRRSRTPRNQHRRDRRRGRAGRGAPHRRNCAPLHGSSRHTVGPDRHLVRIPPDNLTRGDLSFAPPSGKAAAERSPLGSSRDRPWAFSKRPLWLALTCNRAAAFHSDCESVCRTGHRFLPGRSCPSAGQTYCERCGEVRAPNAASKPAQVLKSRANP